MSLPDILSDCLPSLSQRCTLDEFSETVIRVHIEFLMRYPFQILANSVRSLDVVNGMCRNCKKNVFALQ